MEKPKKVEKGQIWNDNFGVFEILYVCQCGDVIANRNGETFLYIVDLKHDEYLGTDFVT